MLASVHNVSVWGESGIEYYISIPMRARRLRWKIEPTRYDTHGFSEISSLSASSRGMLVPPCMTTTRPRVSFKNREPDVVETNAQHSGQQSQ